MINKANLTKTHYYKAGDDCPQCKNGYLKDTGQEKHGDRILKCVSCN